MTSLFDPRHETFFSNHWAVEENRLPARSIPSGFMLIFHPKDPNRPSYNKGSNPLYPSITRVWGPEPNLCFGGCGSLGQDLYDLMLLDCFGSATTDRAHSLHSLRTEQNRSRSRPLIEGIHGRTEQRCGHMSPGCSSVLVTSSASPEESREDSPPNSSPGLNASVVSYDTVQLSWAQPLLNDCPGTQNGRRPSEVWSSFRSAFEKGS